MVWWFEVSIKCYWHEIVVVYEIAVAVIERSSGQWIAHRIAYSDFFRSLSSLLIEVRPKSSLDFLIDDWISSSAKSSMIGVSLNPALLKSIFGLGFDWLK